MPSTVKFADEFKYKGNNGDELTTSGAKDTIKLYGIKYDVDSSAKGDIEVALSGKSLSADYADKTILKVVNAKAVSATAHEAKLQAGSTTMIVDGKEISMDVAPYIKNSRLYVSARFCANALGVDDANIMWDGATRTATIIKGAVVIQMTVGSKITKVNGAAITMDTTRSWRRRGREA